LLRAVAELASTHHGQFRLWTACDPRTPFAASFPESRQERALLEDPLIAAHVNFGSFVPRPQSVLVGDAAVVPSTIESFCFPLAEAAGVGLPTIAADTPFAREVCGDSGVYYPPGDHVALATAMRQVLDGARSGPKPGQATHLSWQTHVDKLAAACQTALASPT